MAESTYIKNKSQRLQRLVLEVLMLKNQLAREGLWKTVHAMDQVQQEIGWEIAEQFGQSAGMSERYKRAIQRTM